MREHGNNWQDLAADLPAPRDDEPPSLRDDIVAELRDHLACAMNRERHATGDEDRAQKNVIEKFGNPAAIAHRLWLDAMKEKIMSQRILIGTVVLLAIACLAASGFAWMAVQEGREVNQLVMANSQSMMESNRGMMENSRAMMEKLTEIAGKPTEDDAPDSIGWVRVQLKLVTNKEGGPPAEGFKATLSGALYGGSGGFGGGDGMQLEETSGPDGTVDFGYVTPGNHYVSVVAPWDDTINQSIVVRPATPMMKTIVCPSEPTADVDLHLDVDWPQDLKDYKFGVVLSYRQELQLDSLVWQPAQPKRKSGGLYGPGSWFINDGGQIAEIYFSDELSPFRTLDTIMVFTRRLNVQFAADYAETVAVKQLPLSVNRIEVIMTREDLAEYLDLSRGGQEFVGQNRFPIIASWPHLEYDPQLGTGVAAYEGKEVVIPPRPRVVDFTKYEPLSFVPQPGEENVWTIELPESLIARTREALQAIDEFKAEHAAAESAATE